MDLQIVNFLNHLGQGTWVDSFSRYISRNRTMTIIWALVITLAIFFKKRYRKSILISFVIAGGLFYLIAELGFKTLLPQEIGSRSRPYVAHADFIQPIGTHYSDPSFPSSHMALTVALATVLILLFPALWPYVIIYVLLMAWSRMHNGMHYPSDIVAGAVI